MKNMLAIILSFFRPAGFDIGVGSLIGAIGSKPTYSGFYPSAGPAEEQKWMQAMNAIQSAVDRNTGLVDPVLLDSYSKLLGIDLNGLVQSGATAGGQYSGLSDTATAGADALTGAGGRTLAAGNDVYNLARDPQHELHDYMREQTIDTSRAADSARGIAMGGVSAGNESDAVRKFEMDWQNQELARSLQGLQGLTGSGYYGGVDLSQGLGMGAQAPGFTMQSGSAPIAGKTAAYSMPMDWSNMFTQAQGQDVLSPYAGMQQQIMPYLGMATNAGANRSNFDMNRWTQSTKLLGMGLDNSGIGDPSNYAFGGGGGGAGAGK